MGCSKTFLVLLYFFFTQFILTANSQSFIGVNYGQLADNLPPPSETAKLLQSTSIGKVRLYGADPAIIKALANTGIEIAIGASNGDIPALANDQNFANQWINSNVKAYYPASKISLVNVGNEIFLSKDQGLISQLLPAMQNVLNALNAVSLGGKVKISTVHAMSVLQSSAPPSAGSFDPAYGDTMKGLLEFLNGTGSPFTINPYPYFAYQGDTRPETLAFCLFQPNAGRYDPGTKINYMNMFDAQVDAIRSALNKMNFKDVNIVVAETGWPYQGDSTEAGATVENAKAYNGNLIAHLRSMAGTPLMPGKPVDTYLFALYDENLKPGPASERAFGLYKPDLSMVYDVSLRKTSQVPVSSPQVQPTKSPQVQPVNSPQLQPTNSPQLQPAVSPDLGSVMSPDLAAPESPDLQPIKSPLSSSSLLPPASSSAASRATVFTSHIFAFLLVLLQLSHALFPTLQPSSHHRHDSGDINNSSNSCSNTQNKQKRMVCTQDWHLRCRTAKQSGLCM